MRLWGARWPRQLLEPFLHLPEFAQEPHTILAPEWGSYSEASEIQRHE